MPYSKRGKAGGIAARPRQAVDQAGPNRIGDVREHDRHSAGCLQQRRHSRAASGQDDVWRERDQFRRVFAGVVGTACAPAILDLQIVSDGPARLLQPLQKRRVAGLSDRAVRRSVMSAPIRRIAVRLLRARRERPRRRRATEKRDELAPLSFDHLVGAGKQRWRNFQTKRIRSLEVDHQLELVGLFDRDVLRMPAL